MDSGQMPSRCTSLLFLLLHSWLTAAIGVEDVEISPCQDASMYEDWLTDPEIFVREGWQGFQGLHILCLWRSPDDVVQLEAYRNALKQLDPERYILSEDTLTSWKAFRGALSENLQLSEPTSNWEHQELKQVFGVFSAKGKRLSSVKAAERSKLLLVTVGGQWFWPPVREGFVRQLPDLKMELETLSLSPVVYQVRGFLQEAECEEIIGLAGSRMQASPVSLMDKDKDKPAKEFRTSSQARISKQESPRLASIDSRVGKLTRIPIDHNEEAQILRYEKTQYYSAHLDNWDPMYYSDSSWFQYGHNNRFITVFWYLTSVDAGGETIFPRAHGLPQPRDMFSCDAGLKVIPQKGTVIFWYSLQPNGNTDPNGLHGACPVEAGTKWSANYWVWNKPRTYQAGADFAEQFEADGQEGDEAAEADTAGNSFLAQGSDNLQASLGGSKLSLSIVVMVPIIILVAVLVSGNCRFCRSRIREAKAL